MKTVLRFNDITFEKGPKEGVRARFLKSFYFDIPAKMLDGIGQHELLETGELAFDGITENKARSKFNMLLDNQITLLHNKFTKKPAIYIHRGSGIPLIGAQSFGIIDRNTSILEVRPVTGCNINCLYCSVDEGISTRKVLDFVVERDYLVEEFKKLVEYKGCEHIEAHIGTQGDPTLYGPLVDLVRDLAAIPQVKEIAMDTNGMLLTEKMIDDLAEAGMTRINLSVNAMDPLLAKKVAGYGGYNLEHARKMATYAAKKMTLLIAPVLVQGINEGEMRKIVLFAKEIGAKVGIQNFLKYKRGRNPAEQMPWDNFFALLKGIEEETGMKLLLTKADFNITYTKKLVKPFKKNDIVEAEIKCPARLPGEVIAVANERAILVRNCHKTQGNVRLKLDRTKHNIFIGHAV